MKSRFFLYLIVCYLFSLDLGLAQGNLCAMNKAKTEKMLEHLENRLLCETLPIGDCIKLFAGGAAIGGALAAKKLLNLGKFNINPDVDIICSSRKITVNNPFFSSPRLNLFLLISLVSKVEASPNQFCQLHPGALFRNDIASLEKAMSQELDHDIQNLYKAGEQSSKKAGDVDKAKKYLSDTAEGYLSSLKEVPSDEARRIYPSVERQIREAREKGDFRTVRGLIKSSIKHLETQGVDLKPLSVDFDEFRSHLEIFSQGATLPQVPCNVLKEIQTLVQANTSNRVFVKSEIEKMKTKCPTLNVDDLTERTLAVSRKRVALSLVSREKLMFEMDMRKLSQQPTHQMQNVASKMKEFSRQSIEKLNRISLSQFHSPEIGLMAGKLDKWGKGLGLSATSLYTFTKTARALSPVALLAGGKAALASTGVGLLPVIAETAVEEVILQSVTYKPEDCIAQDLRSARNLNATSKAKLGYQYLSFDSTNCQASIELGSQLADFLQLQESDRLDILSQNDKMCSAIHKLYHQENKLSDFEASCTSNKGEFHLRDLISEKGNFKLIQQRSREAREAKLTGDDYEKYVRGNLVSRDQIVTINSNFMNIHYPSTVSKLSQCSTFKVNLTEETQSFQNSCLPLTRPVLDSVYDYALLSAQCSSTSQGFSDLYGKNFVGKKRNQTMNSDTINQR